MTRDHPAALVHLGTDTVTMSAGDELIVGRGATAGLRVGVEPPDERVSREHVVLHAEPGAMTVTRLSRTQLVVVRTTSSSFFLEAPRESVSRGGAFAVLLPRTPAAGEHPPTYYWVDVDVIPLTVESRGPESSRLTVPTMDLPRLSDRDVELLAAYAAPMISGIDTDHPVSATHQEVAEHLHYAKEWCRERIDRLRKRLETDGWPVGEDKDSLCRWAVAMGLVGRDD